MHSIKGGWVGQTFALATSNDSGGKKARIRRSKEERKEMVISFIKRYQKSNNGNFPSLNLTHKEVGGSFYIVREIVREVIQENRVLGPAKLTAEEQKKSSFVEQYPLGSISTEPQIHVFSAEETHVSTNLRQSTTGEHLLNSNGNLCEPEHRISKDNQVVDSNPVALGKDQESDDSSITHSMQIDVEYTSEQQFSGSVEQFSGPPSQQFANEEVTDNDAILQEEKSNQSISTDAFPIPHHKTSIEHLQCCSKELAGSGLSVSSSKAIASRSIQESLGSGEFQDKMQVESLEQESSESKKDEGATERDVLEAGMTQMTADVVETFPLRPVSKIIHELDERSGESAEITDPLEERKTEDNRVKSLGNGSGSRNMKDQATQEVLEVDENKETMDGRAVLAAHLESTNESTIKKSNMPEHSGITGLDTASSSGETKHVVAPNGIHHKNLNFIDTSGPPKQSIPVETSSNQNRLNGQHESSFKKGSSPALNRINLETWEGRSRKPAGSETNPLLALVKAFITAFVKFWTE